MRQARAAIAQLVPDEELRQRAVLVVSELATNAVLHAEAPFVLRAWRRAGTLRVELEDCSPVLPTLAGETTMSGRGLRIVEALSSRWGARPQGVGKVVWAELSLGPAPETTPGP